jgi:peptidoglycan hydrolase-like protein with peptidoglycan-binding domain
MDDGRDVRQLERNLRALGHDPAGQMAVDDEWDWATSAAVRRFQAARGLAQDGTLARGKVVFRPGATRIGQAKAAIGQQAAPGRELAEVSSTERRVTVKLAATRQRLARTGDRVSVELPTGRTARGRITAVAKVAETQPGDDDAEPRSRSRSSCGARPPAARTSTRRPSTSASRWSAATECWRCRSRPCSPAREAASRSS